MPRPHSERTGEQARFANRKTHYSPSVKEIPRAYVLVSDPWGYLLVFLQNEATRRPKFRRQFEDAEYFLNLTREYFKAASTVAAVTRPLLYYYGYLNLSKAYLSLSGQVFGRKKENHGLTLENLREVRIYPRNPTA